MTLDEFLQWEGKQDGRLEFIAGEPRFLPLSNQKRSLFVSDLVATLKGATKTSHLRVLVNFRVPIRSIQECWYPAIVIDSGPYDADAMEPSNPFIVIDVERERDWSVLDGVKAYSLSGNLEDNQHVVDEIVDILKMEVEEGRTRLLAAILEQPEPEKVSDLIGSDGPGYVADGIRVIGIFGMAPVQAHGQIDGHFFYFRARGAEWRIEIGGSDDGKQLPIIWHSGEWGTWPDAGYMSQEQAFDLIKQGAAKFREQSPTRPAPGDPRYERFVLQAWSDNAFGYEEAAAHLGITVEEVEARAIVAHIPWPELYEFSRKGNMQRKWKKDLTGHRADLHARSPDFFDALWNWSKRMIDEAEALKSVHLDVGDTLASIAARYDIPPPSDYYIPRSGDYTDNSIKFLEGLDPPRKRPEGFISTDEPLFGDEVWNAADNPEAFERDIVAAWDRGGMGPVRAAYFLKLDPAEFLAKAKGQGITEPKYPAERWACLHKAGYEALCNRIDMPNRRAGNFVSLIMKHDRIPPEKRAEYAELTDQEITELAEIVLKAIQREQEKNDG